MQINEVLKRKPSGEGPKSLRLTGVDGKNWTAQAADVDFGPTISISPIELYKNYVGATGEETPFFDELATRNPEEYAKAQAQSRQRAQIIEQEQQKSALPPETIFAMSEEEQGELKAKKARKIKQRLAEARIEWSK
jgi:hypothetical protein